MRSVVVHPPSPGAGLEDRPIPTRTLGQVRVAVRAVGVCGTDRDIAAGKYGRPPEGRSDLILGHENLGRVVEADPGAGQPSVGDWVVATVRRGCGRCRWCLAGHSDCCATGAFTERGISGADGYMAEQYVEDPAYLIQIPPDLAEVAILLEPLSVVEKAIRVGAAVRAARLPDLGAEPPLRTLVAGSGAVGMLAALALRCRGAEVTVVDRHPGETPAARLLEQAGAVHATLDTLPATGSGPGADLVIEATGAADLPYSLEDRLAPNGTLVLTGIPSADSSVPSGPAGPWARSMVLGDRAVVGSVNAGRSDFETGVRDLGEFRRRWGPLVGSLLTAHLPIEAAPMVLGGRQPGEIKTVLEFPPATSI